MRALAGLLRKRNRLLKLFEFFLAKAFEGFERAVSDLGFEFIDGLDPAVVPELRDTLGPQARDVEHLQDTRRDAADHLLMLRDLTIAQELFDLLRDAFADALDLQQIFRGDIADIFDEIL